MRRQALAVTLTALLTLTIAGGTANADDRTMAKSKYRGKYWTADLAACREAIGRRESGFSYRAKNPSSSASGFYQFLDRSWRVPLTRALRPEIRKAYPEKLEMLNELDQVPIRYWPAFYQDAAFYTVVVRDGGIRHWSPVPQACR